MFDFIRRRRRRKLKDRPFPEAWRRFIARNAPSCRDLSPEQRRELEGLVQVFIVEKNFEGCGGLEMSDEIRVTVAARACRLLLGRETDVFPRVQSVLVYPTTFVTRVVEADDDGLVSEYDDPLDGEAWQTGAVILAWDDVLRPSATRRGGYDVVVHEFAHQLDLESGEADGLPRLPARVDPRRWAETFRAAYDAHVRDVARGAPTVLDPYGAEDPGEFFAVAVEAYVTHRKALRRRHPELCAQLQAYLGYP